MSTAFLQFSDPYAWLIRGFVESEWQDLTLLSTQILPQKTGAGFDLRHLIQTRGRFGIRISVMAIDIEGHWYAEDQLYSFDIIFGQDHVGEPSFLVSSKDTAFSEFFPFSSFNPQMCIEQLIERIQKRHVPQFVNERQRGRTITAHEINGMFTTRPIPCNPHLIQFLYQRTQNGLSFDSAISEGLWFPTNQKGMFQSNQESFSQPPLQRPPQQQERSPAEQPMIQSQQPIQGNPIIQSGISAGQGLGAIMTEGNVVGDERGQAIQMLQTPASALRISSFVGMTFGGAEFINAVLIFLKINQGTMVIPNKSYYFFLFVMHMMISLYCISGGVLAYLFNKDYRQIGSGIRASFAMLYPSTIPLCCFAGIPISIWSFLIWNKKEVKSFRKQ
jgi:hypothetical protein